MLLTKSLFTPWVLKKTPQGFSRYTIYVYNTSTSFYSRLLVLEWFILIFNRCKNFTSAINVPSSLIKQIQKTAPGKPTVNDIVTMAVLSAMTQILTSERLRSKVRVGSIIAMLPYPNFHPRNRFTNYSYKTNARIQIGNDQGQDIPKVLSELAVKNMKSLLGPQSLTCLWVFDFFGRFPAWVISIIMNGAYDSSFLMYLLVKEKPV